MNFSQGNKINNGFVPQQRQHCMQGSHQFSNQTQSSVAQQFRNVQHNRINQQMTHHRPNQSFARPRNACGDRNALRTTMPDLDTMYEFNESSVVPANSFCDESSYDQQPKLQILPANLESEDELNVEYVQCALTPSRKARKPNLSKQVIQSMRRYSKSKLRPIDMKPETNHRIFVMAHEESVDEEEILGLDGSKYRTTTKTEIIPKGIRIITDIVKVGEAESTPPIACHTTTQTECFSKTSENSDTSSLNPSIT